MTTEVLARPSAHTRVYKDIAPHFALTALLSAASLTSVFIFGQLRLYGDDKLATVFVIPWLISVIAYLVGNRYLAAASAAVGVITTFASSVDGANDTMAIPLYVLWLMAFVGLVFPHPPLGLSDAATRVSVRIAGIWTVVVAAIALLRSIHDEATLVVDPQRFLFEGTQMHLLLLAGLFAAAFLLLEKPALSLVLAVIIGLPTLVSQLLLPLTHDFANESLTLVTLATPLAPLLSVVIAVAALGLLRRTTTDM